MRQRQSGRHMVKHGLLSVGLALVASQALAESPIERFFPGKSGCYVRNYTAKHLASHPKQRVTGIAVIAEASIADPMIGLWTAVDLRGVPGGSYEALAYCEPVSADALRCGMEGDAGSYTLSPSKDGAILIEVGPYGMSFEGDQGFATLESQSGDDRSFILYPAACP